MNKRINTRKCGIALKKKKKKKFKSKKESTRPALGNEVVEINEE